MEVVQQSNSSFGNGGESFGSAFQAALSEASGAPAPEQSSPMDAVDGQPVQAKEDQGASPVQQASQEKATAEEIEFEGKKIALDKSARDYALAELNAKKGMRKAFSERDSIKKQLEEAAQRAGKWDQIESVFKGKGIEGLFDALSGKDGAYKDHVKGMEEKAIRRYNATEDELKIIEREEAIEATRQRAEIAEKLLKEQHDKIQGEKEAANKEVLEGKILSAHEKVSFKGKLGDEKKEDKFDSYVWERVRMRLNEYVQEKKIDAHLVPGKVVSALFDEEAADFSDAFRSQIEASTKAALSKQSDAATLAAQAKATAGVKTAPQNIEQLADANNGSIAATLRAMFGRQV